jgi:glutamate mutase epsilon subunit
MAIDDPVNSPKHYTQGDMEVITAIEGLGLDYHQGNVLKYISRYRFKNGMEDLQKAKWYVDRLIYIYEQDAIKTQRSMV